MHTFEATTADELWLRAVERLRSTSEGRVQESRAGVTHELLHVGFTLRDPRQRWVISRDPSISVAFAIAEVVGILNGRRDAGFLNYWNRDLPRFAGTGNTYHGAYGHRLRSNFGFDQLERGYLVFKHQPHTRQVVLQIWDPRIDFPAEDGRPVAEDIPCNICSLLKVRDGRLEWLQVMRSNDLFKGLPYNFVQFTCLQEVLAGWLGLEVGEYTHISDSLHLYDYDFESAYNAQPSASVINRDSLLLPKNESDAVWAEMNRCAEELGQPDVTTERLVELSSSSDLPPAYNNLLVVLAAEAARRRKDAETGLRIVEYCTNTLLKELWLRWTMRKRKEADKRGAATPERSQTA
jgi:thymidylate synthase